MNESRHPIDDLFREGLESQQFEAPAHVWERIDQKRTPLYKLANNFRQNYRFYLSVVAGLALLSSFALWFLTDEVPGNQVAQADPSAVTMNEDVAPANSDPAAQASLFEATPKAEKPAQGTPNTQANPNPQSTRPIVADQNDEPTNAVIPTPSPETAATPAQPEVEENQETPKVEEPIEEPAPKQEEPSTPETSEIPPVVETAPEVQQPEVKEQEIQKEESPVVEAQESEPKTEVNPDEAKQNNKTAQPPLTRPWSFELAGSYDFVTRQILTSNPLYQSTRNGAERFKSAFTFQARLGYEFKPGVIVKTGLSYSRINEHMTFDDPYQEQEITERQETGWIVDPINGPRQISYTVRDTQDVTKYRSVTSPNTYTFIDLPLMVQYNFYGTGRWNFGATAGMLVNLRFGQSGRTLHSNAVDVINLGTDQNPFKTRANVDLMLNLSASYRLYDNLDILIEPAARFGTGSLMREGFGATQRYNRYSLYTGVRYRF